YIDHYAGSDEMGMEFRPFYMAREWVKLGHEVTVLAADFSHLRKKNPVIKKDFEETFDSGVRFVWLKSNRYRHNGVGRFINMFGFSRKLKMYAKKIAEAYKPDAVIASSTYPMDNYGARKIADAAGAGHFYEIHDLWPLSLMVMGNVGEKNPFIMYVQKAEDFAFRSCDKVISILPFAYRHMEERGFSKDKFVCIPNGIVTDSEATELSRDSEQYKKLRGLKDEKKFIVMYAGGHALSNALDSFILSADYLPENAVLVLVGDGAEKQNLVSLSNGRKNVIFLPSVKKSDMQSLLKFADCLYVGAKNSRLYAYGVGMNKIYDYMLSAKPIIYAVGSANRPVEDANCGIAVEPEDPKAVANAVSELMGMSADELEELGQNGRKCVMENHDYKILAERFLREIR
ncbi:MAG: glycosyltransferase family 4 protein, partial [Acutalibacteraceae bacterium]